MDEVKWRKSKCSVLWFQWTRWPLWAASSLWSRSSLRAGAEELKSRPGIVRDLNTSEINFLVFKKLKKPLSLIYSIWCAREKNIYIGASVIQVMSHVSSNLFMLIQWIHQLQRDHSHDSRFGGSGLICVIAWKVRKWRTVFFNIPFLYNIFTFFINTD